jgi:hypothetical protein
MRIRLRHAFSAIATVVVVHGLALLLQWYGRWPDFDIPMHFAGGFVMGLLAIALQHEFLRFHGLPGAAWWHELLFVLGFVALIAIGWELHEFLIDEWWGRTAGALSQLSLRDTMGDLAIGLIGATVAHGMFRPGRTPAVTKKRK